MFGSKQSRSKVLAFAIVAMFVVAVLPFGMDDSDANPYGGISGNYGDAVNSEYNIPLSVGQTFNYTPTTNLGTAGYGTVTFSWAGDSEATQAITMASSATGALSGSFAAVPSGNGIASATLTATWTSPEAPG